MSDIAGISPIRFPLVLLLSGGYFDPMPSLHDLRLSPSTRAGFREPPSGSAAKKAPEFFVSSPGPRWAFPEWWDGVALLMGALSPRACGSGTSGPDPDPPVPATLAVVQGMNTEAPVRTVLPEGPTVELRDQYGDPIQDMAVSFEVLEGLGHTPVTSRDTDNLGQARIPWILGPDPGQMQRLQASVGPLSVVIEATTIDPVSGDSYFGRNQYIEYLAGDLPVVVSAPHGGDLRPSEIPDRTQGVLTRDMNTRDLALRVRKALWDRTGSYPHIVISHLHRSKLDPNRFIDEAAQGSLEAERAWWEFQTYIEAAEAWVEEEFGEGLYFDLHGHGHEIQRLELGYLLSATDLANSDERLTSLSLAERSSVRALSSKPGVDFPELIRGPGSLGSLFEARGFPAVPSQSQPDPGSNPYFSGGHNTLVHGSRDGGTVSGVQIECNFNGVRDNGANRDAFAEALADLLMEFFPTWYGWDLARAEQIPFGIGSDSQSF